MSLTNRILMAMAAGIVLGSGLEVLLTQIDAESSLAQIYQHLSYFWCVRRCGKNIHSFIKAVGRTAGIGVLDLRYGVFG